MSRLWNPITSTLFLLDLVLSTWFVPEDVAGHLFCYLHSSGFSDSHADCHFPTSSLSRLDLCAYFSFGEKTLLVVFTPTALINSIIIQISVYTSFFPQKCYSRRRSASLLGWEFLLHVRVTWKVPFWAELSFCVCSTVTSIRTSF